MTMVAGVKRILTVALIVRRMLSIRQHELATDRPLLAASHCVHQRPGREQPNDQREKRCHDRRVRT